MSSVGRKTKKNIGETAIKKFNRFLLQSGFYIFFLNLFLKFSQPCAQKIRWSSSEVHTLS